MTHFPSFKIAFISFFKPQLFHFKFDFTFFVFIINIFFLRFRHRSSFVNLFTISCKRQKNIGVIMRQFVPRFLIFINTNLALLCKFKVLTRNIVMTFNKLFSTFTYHFWIPLLLYWISIYIRINIRIIFKFFI